MLLNYTVLGKGPALVVLHGLFGSLDNWLTLGRQWAGLNTVYLVDQRNHGRSPHDPRIDFPAMAADLQELFAREGIRQASVLGHSMGGKTAMRFALDYPELTASLIVADMAPKTYPSGHDLIFEALAALELPSLQSREDAEEKMTTLITDPGVRLFLLKNLTRNKDGSFRWKMNLDAIRAGYPYILEKIDADFPYSGPVCFIRGSRSAYVEDRDWPEIIRLFPQATLITLPDAGHWLHADQPAAFAAAVQDFLGRVG